MVLFGAFLVHAKSVHQDAIRFVVMNLFAMILFDFSLLLMLLQR